MRLLGNLRVLNLAALGITLLALSGCAASSLREAVPEKLASNVKIAGMGNVRAWGDHSGGALKLFLAEELPLIKAQQASLAKDQPLHSHILALSGGADDGAFGAGLLVGWTARGTRPQFNVVTGISAGALIAPFAFLGADYDPQLRAIFSNTDGDDIYKTNILQGLTGGTALADSAPLAALIEKYVDAELMARLARERAKNRLLIIGTTNLDAQRPVYWDVGKIAQSGRPDAIQLIRKVLLASASIPGLFPPVNIRVTSGGKSYEEMHVDGGPTREVFFAPADFSFRALDKLVGRDVQRTLWVIRNGKLEPEYAPVDSNALAISQRSLETLTKYQGLGDLARMYQKARSEGIAFNLSSIPASFSAPRPQPFARDYMRTLFDAGYGLGKTGVSWAKVPPGARNVGG